MMETKRSIIILMIAALMFFVPFVPSTVVGNTENGVTRENEGANPYCRFSIFGLKSWYYYGESGSFWIGVQNTYDGRLWNGEGTDPTSRAIYNARLEMKTSTLMLEGREQEFDCLDETEPGSLRVDNGQYGQGYAISPSSTRYYFSNNSESIHFKFDVGRQGFPEGHYRINLSLYFNVRVDLSVPSPDGYAYSQELEQEGSVDIYINSYVENQNAGGKELTIISNGQAIIPYSGSQDSRLKYPPLYCFPYKILDQFRGELEFEDEGIEIEPVSTQFSSLTSNGHELTWKLNLSDDIKPGYHFGKLFFRYLFEEELYIEGPYLVNIRVRNTPLITPVSSEMEMNPTLLMEQKEPYRTIRINFTNNGNVPIWKLRVWLDIDSSKFIKRYVEYFDEGEGSKEVYENVEFVEFNIAIGQTVVAEFRDLIISDIMPPGRYFIPFDYELTYRDPESAPSSESFLHSYQMDEVGENDWVDVMKTRIYPREIDVKPPHMVLRVMDDHPDLEADSSIFLEPGSVYNEIEIILLNKEQYVMRDFSYILKSDDSSLVHISNSSGIPFILSYDARRSINRAEDSGPGTFTINSFVDVRSNIESTITSATLEMSFRDSENKKRWVNLSIPIIIRSSPARIDIISIDTGKVSPGEDFTVNVEIMNTGGTTIRESELRLISRDNSIQIPNSVYYNEPLGPGEIAEVTFHCTALEHLDPGNSYTLYLMTSLMDKDDNYENFTLRSDSPVYLSATGGAEKEDITGSIDSMGLLILIGMIISAIIIGCFIFLSNHFAGKRWKESETIQEKNDKNRTDTFDEIFKKEKSPFDRILEEKPEKDTGQTKIEKTPEVQSPPAAQSPVRQVVQQPARISSTQDSGKVPADASNMSKNDMKDTVSKQDSLVGDLFD
ncbi:hypothetical protein B6U90_04360 [Thermoplasmatales archaeon ex4484_6]|nr:MAG: hypothetical protein B6U90_04360 [Thermoplasmatales archaeon ex4484_6]